MVKTLPTLPGIIPATEVETSILRALRFTPTGIVVVIICSDARHELRATGNGPTNPLGQDGTYVQRRKLYALEHRLVYPMKLADIVGCLADPVLGPLLLEANRALLEQATVIELWSHRTCAGAGKKFLLTHDRPMMEEDENEALPDQLERAFAATVAYAHELGSNPLAIGFIDHMTPGEESSDALLIHPPW